jgi:hypothetical protein
MTNRRPRTPRHAAVLGTTGLLLLAACTGVNAGPSTTTTPRTSAPAQTINLEFLETHQFGTFTRAG